MKSTSSPKRERKMYYTVNTFSFREQEFYYQEQDQRSDENHFLNIYILKLSIFK